MYGQYNAQGDSLRKNVCKDISQDKQSGVNISAGKTGKESLQIYRFSLYLFR